MKCKKITIVAGARPNFIKIAPIIHSINKANRRSNEIEYRLVHTGQHYDENMSKSFFEQLDIPKPDINLECSGGSQAEQTAAILINFERELISNPSDLVLVVGDVTSTMACALVAQKLKIKVAHVEAGIRSNDWSMPEEINRLVTDSITNYFFTTTKSATQHLINCGVDEKNVFFVGNTMIDTLLKHKSMFKKPNLWDTLELSDKNYVIITLHRPSNVDEQENLRKIIHEIIKSSHELKLIFPMHPRTYAIFKKLGISHERLKIVDPLPYLEFNYLVERSKLVITDSGGITEETTVLGIPCITLRDNTERPETITIGTNELIGKSPKKIPEYFQKLMNNSWKKGGIPELWDGNTSERIIKTIIKLKI